MSLESVSSDKPDPKDEGDEAIISMSVAGEVTDSSIVEVGRSRPQFQYTREELMEIKVAPLSKRRPDCLDVAYNNKHGIWDPERWHLDRKRSETPPEEEPANRTDHVPENHAKRRSGDPRERIRKEQDGIVLSPQRRSFNSGCFVNVSQPPLRRPESPLGKSEVPHREPVRRIGSGRILNRDMWDFRSENDKLDSDRSEFSFRPGGGGPLRDRDNRDNREAGNSMRDRDNIRDRDDRTDRYERRSFGRDFGDRDRDRDRERGLERNERNHQNERDKDRGRDRRYGNDRRRTYSDQREAEEPEWFSSGPTSQHDTIELRGFEDIPEEKTNNTTKGKKQSPAQKKRAKKAAEKEEKQNENHSSGPKGRSTPNSMEQQINVGPAPHSPILEQNEQQSPHPKEKSDESKITPSEQNFDAIEKSSASQTQETKPPDFNLDDFLKSDTFPGVPGLLTNGVGSNGGAGSRFSQWFKRESPVQQLDSRNPSIQDELLNNLLNDISEPKIKIPSVTESNAFFAPISPANTTNHTASATGVKLLEMLQRGNKANQNGQGDAANPVVQMMKNSSIKDMEQSGKVVHSLEELEARMRGGPPPPVSNEPPRITKTDEDLSAFKKLLAQVTGGQAVPAANGPIPQKQQPITLMQLLNTQLKSQTPIPQHQNAEPMRPPTFNHVGPLGPVQHPHQSQLQHENLMKVLHVQQQQQQQQKQRQEQQQMLSMMMGGQRMMGVSPIPPDVQMMVNCAPATRELLQRPEAQAIIHGLQQGEITRQHLVQQLQNPAMQHRHREVLVNILKVYGGTTPRTVSPHASVPTPQDHMLQQMLYQQQQQQQQRIPSPMNNVMPHRVPSPRELVMHTQTIIQNALIKKKLEEQRENFRKRQEQQQHQQQKHQLHQNAPSPVNSPAKQTQSPTPLAFTPTSVLRKMTAEKEPEGNNDPSKMISQNPAARRDELSVIADFAHQVALVAAGESRVPPTRSQQPVHPSWQNPAVKQHPGRPIVKGGGGTQFQYSGNIDFQQQQQQQRAIPGMYGNPASRSKHTMVAPLPHPNVPQFNVTSNSVMGQRSNQMTSQMKAQQLQSHLASLQQQQQRTANPQIQLALNQNYNSSRNDGRVIRPQQLNIGVGRQTSPGLGFMGSTGGDLSPTSNQLARWFSPELLAQARAGKLPELGQTNLLSVEELERLQHASTTVHN